MTVTSSGMSLQLWLVCLELGPASLSPSGTARHLFMICCEADDLRWDGRGPHWLAGWLAAQHPVKAVSTCMRRMSVSSERDHDLPGAGCRGPGDSTCFRACVVIGWRQRYRQTMNRHLI
ncbi:hypothetical protein B0I35DRAFT_432695 [Stachybotrys elegans]|uniref:Secreted protein n=1 Tax=Stachybotrys elegans TaxID=80388 RepID=A0A8K0SVQ0_9HYPO|nr:hypothetical protein B0I35DRAFT_432695 [Stachybotrys elegans]